MGTRMKLDDGQITGIQEKFFGDSVTTYQWHIQRVTVQQYIYNINNIMVDPQIFLPSFMAKFI